MRKRLAGSGWLLLCVMLLWWSMPCGSFAEETDGGQTEEALEDYTEELALSPGIRNYYGVTIHLEELQQWSLEILGDWVLPAHANQ